VLGYGAIVDAGTDLQNPHPIEEGIAVQTRRGLVDQQGVQMEAVTGVVLERGGSLTRDSIRVCPRP
jgi:hypothetical protein